ncbi:hypothetical protein OEZ86_001812 [Tetradesmus obliquus]|nr:hypothetical protein OEZ86_001812 [Tetradesmus obliquus]
MRLTGVAAQELLLDAINAAGLPTMALLEETEQLALAVAWLRNQGAASDSKWAAYVASMGAGNPCGWAKSQQQLSADHAVYLHTLALDESWWRYFVAQVQQQMQQQAGRLAERYGQALGLSAADVLWGLGQVTARKVLVDEQAMLEPWSDMLRHPPAHPDSSSSSRCEIQWTYGLSRDATTVMGRGAGRRVPTRSSSNSTTDAAAAAAAAEEGPALLLQAGEELWASSSGGAAGDLFDAFIQEHGHLAPLAWYLQHGVVPEGLAGVNMRTSDILDSWRRTVASQAAGSSAASSASSSSSSSSSGSSRPTVLWDYLTQQYQQDCLTVLAATPAEHQQPLLQFLMQPVGPDTAAAAAAAAAAEPASAAAAGSIVPDVDPLPLIGALDELLIAAIDAAEEDE